MSVYPQGIRAPTTAATLRVIAVAAGLLLLAWLLANVLLLIFAAVLLAVILRGMTNAIMRCTGIRDGIALATGTILLALTLSGMIYYLGPRLVTQGQELWTGLHRQFHALDQTYGDTAWGKLIFHQVSPSLGLDRKIASSTEAVVTSTADYLITTFVVTITAIYFAINPGLYVTGVVALVPVPYRTRAREILHHIRMTLSWWLIGQCIDMVVVGLMSAIGLSVLGVPLWLALAVVAGLLTFIPYFGAIAAAVPAVMVSLTVGWHLALWVLGVFVCTHAVEAYVIAPLVQRRTVHLPPAVTILSMMILGDVAGPLGIILGAPIAATLLVIVREAYVEDVLGRSQRRHLSLDAAMDP
jgi:predicted PurR-regulated permease PerM